MESPGFILVVLNKCPFLACSSVPSMIRCIGMASDLQGNIIDELSSFRSSLMFSELRGADSGFFKVPSLPDGCDDESFLTVEIQSLRQRETLRTKWPLALDTRSIFQTLEAMQ